MPDALTILLVLGVVLALNSKASPAYDLIQGKSTMPPGVLVEAGDFEVWVPYEGDKLGATPVRGRYMIEAVWFRGYWKDGCFVSDDGGIWYPDHGWLNKAFYAVDFKF